jgi:hypothetical protein
VSEKEDVEGEERGGRQECGGGKEETTKRRIRKGELTMQEVLFDCIV